MPGSVSGSPPGLVARGARQRASQMNGHPAGWLADRTRLTGRLAFRFLRPHLNRSDNTLLSTIGALLRASLPGVLPEAVMCAQIEHAVTHPMQSRRAEKVTLRHRPVMLGEVLAVLAPRDGEVH